MTSHAPLVRKLADRLRRKEITHVAYFHTDHFEPWRRLGKAAAIGPESVQAVHEFCQATAKIDFARRLTLFYKPHVGYALRRDPGLLRVDPDDLVGFRPRNETHERCGIAAMREVATSSAHDIQLHLHHESYTATGRHTDPAAVAWFASPLGRALDERRLELAIRLSREAIARETGRAAARWFFVHGQWALNACDGKSCTITNEIEVLLRNGCAGDFTFPADYAHANPRIRAPYFCRPHNEAKGYDRPEAEPEIACGNAGAAAAKFFIWASPATARQCSLDYLIDANRRRIENIERAAKRLIDSAYVEDRRLFIKTHAHSMHRGYFERSNGPLFPHQYPAIRSLLAVLFAAADHAGLAVEFLTAPEVYDALVSARTRPEVDLAAFYRKPQEKLRTGLSRLSLRVRSLSRGGVAPDRQ